jgi:hypothetical protein
VRHFHSNVLGFIVLQDGLRELTTVKPDVEGDVTTEEHEGCVGRWVCSSDFLLMSGLIFDR